MLNRNLLASIRIACRALYVNKMRSILTMLGIIIGVSAVIILMALGTGAKRFIQEQIAGIGSNLLIVWPGSQTSGGVRMGAGGAVTLTESDARAIGLECPAVAACSPVQGSRVQVVYRNFNWSTSVQGVWPDYLQIRGLRVTVGSPFTEQDVQAAAKVALLGMTVASNLFGAIDPIGETIRIGRVPFLVIGLLEPKGQSMMGQDQDDQIIVPLSTTRMRIMGANAVNAQTVNQVMVQATGGNTLIEAEDQMKTLLRQRHRLQDEENDDFQVANMEELSAAAQGVARAMTLFLAGIASVSLIVGGIGIMNTMLISVTERTREIGLRLAVGARTRDILAQFLVESTTLSLLGGLIGILLGEGVSLLVTTVIRWEPLVSAGPIVLAFGFSSIVGIFFGYYPARKAAYLDPIEALRYE